MAKRFYELQKNITDLYDKIRKDEALMHRDITDLHYLRQISISNHGIIVRFDHLYCV